MAEFDNTNRGVLFKNQYRKTDKHPDYTGNINVEGKELDLAAWVRKSKKGVVTSVLVCLSRKSKI